MTLAPRFSSSRPKARFVGRQRSKLAKIADPLSKRCSTSLILVVQADAFTLRTRSFKIYSASNVKHSRSSHFPILSLRGRIQAALQRISGPRRSTLDSQSPISRYQSTSPGDGMSSDTPPTGRERLAIRFLAGEQTRQRTTSTSAGGSSGAPQDYVRQRAISTHVPSASSSRHGLRPSTPAPSRLGPGGGLTAMPTLHATPPDTRGRTYHLEVEQHPERTAEFGPAVLSRLPLAPAPIVKLTIRDHTGSPIDPNTELPYLIAHLSLCTESGHPLDGGVPGAPSQHVLYGTLVSSAQVLRNLRGRVAPYFIFPDVSIRQRGRYTLHISLVRLPGIGGPASVSAGNRGNTLATVYTQVFEVVSQSNYAAPQPTPLTQLFIRQGARMYAFESSFARHTTHD
ncbi:uncharacterized protein FOMMEDRAFT_130722 [Fomitiporia mediterranea MF3/22]|uniref:uncharacterized protein n=1 Tax=Fomitiporia mediterranea (strain MF3/22) TaxID=694068 RepID=UPI0004407B42|nr:uncharacterized protein FOMMEDRAFT_130722 [Fomitiporia mediterranea MF3/22]EJD07564.1 hypothetical protein FOMMEDRAFT_130722 [Fomitiporia mediterranea MF3/22]